MKILYVEDDPDLREIVTIAVGLDASMELRAFSSGEAALKALDAGNWRPDALLLDVMMPGLDGVATLREIRRRAQYATTPAAFISAKRDPSLAAADSHVVGLLDKPFDPMTLPARLVELFSQHRLAAHGCSTPHLDALARPEAP